MAINLRMSKKAVKKAAEAYGLIDNSVDGVDTSEDNLLKKLNGTLTDVSYPGLTSASPYGLASAVCLKSARFPDIQKIPSHMFFACPALVAIEAPMATSIEQYAFSGCVNLPAVDMPLIEQVESYAFERCGNLKTINTPELLTIGAGAFYSCGFDSINLDNVTTIDDNAFENCANLTSVSAPNLIQLNNRIFNNCTALRYANFPSAVSIRSQVFSGCSNLSSIYLPNVTDASGIKIFESCTSLSEIRVPKGRWLNTTASTGYSLFYIASSNATLKIADFYGPYPDATTGSPNKLTRTMVHGYSFVTKTSGNQGLTAFILRSTVLVPLATNTVFHYTPICPDSTYKGLYQTDDCGTGYIYVPAELVDEYKAADNWSFYASQIRAIEDYPEICDPGYTE